MRKIFTTSFQPFLLTKTRVYFLGAFFWFASVLSTTNLFAQTFPTSCTSKDLTLLKADLPAPANDRCNCSGTRVLILGIRNGTNSFRTSFALWGTLIRKNAAGTVVATKSIFACASGIQGKTDNYLPASTIELDGVPVTTNAQGQPVIQVNCGESIDIIDMHLAWTSASPSETCDVLKNNPSTINPKCGTQDVIHVGIGVDATFTTTAATCVTGGKIKVTPSGGLSPYEVSLDNLPFVAVPTNTGYYEFVNVSGGQHAVVIRDNTNKPVAERCSTTKSPIVSSTTPPTAAITANRTTVNCTNTSATLTASGGGTYSWSPGGATTAEITVSPTTNTNYTVTVTGANGCTSQKSQLITVDQTPPIFSVCIVQPTLCTQNGSVTFSASSGSGFTYSIDNGTNFRSSATINNLPSGSVSGFQVKGANGCVAIATCEGVTVSCPENLLGVKRQTIAEQEITLNSVPKTNVLAAPNPFNDRIRFILKSSVSGQGSLELYNMSGQRLKTVFSGYVKANETQNIEYAVPYSQRANMIYLFRVGTEKTTGKLVGLK